MLLATAHTACWKGGGAGDATLANKTSSAQRDLEGAYWCSIEDSGYTYPPFPCAIRKIGERFVLAKLGGSQRFQGEVRAQGDGFTFAGQFYCPWGDCTQALHGSFRPAGGGALKGTFRDARFVVTMKPAPDSAFGGVAYGGDSYGGWDVGGTGYGDATGGADGR